MNFIFCAQQLKTILSLLSQSQLLFEPVQLSSLSKRGFQTSLSIINSNNTRIQGNTMVRKTKIKLLECKLGEKSLKLPILSIR